MIHLPSSIRNLTFKCRLLRILRKERQTILSLTSLGLSASQAIDLVADPSIGRAASAQPGSGTLDGYFDASDREEGGDVLLWWNDIEKDRRYQHWSPSLVAVSHFVHL